MAGRLEVMQFVSSIIEGSINDIIHDFENADDEKRMQIAHLTMVIKRTLGDPKSFDHKSVRPDNCYIICVAVI